MTDPDSVDRANHGVGAPAREEPFPRLHVVEGGGLVQVVPLDEQAATVWIGRHADCRIRVPEEYRFVSRTHACVRRNGRYFTLESASSDVGVFVNEEEIRSACTLQHGDRISLTPPHQSGWPAEILFLDEVGASSISRPRPGASVDAEVNGGGASSETLVAAPGEPPSDPEVQAGRQLTMGQVLAVAIASVLFIVIIISFLR